MKIASVNAHVTAKPLLTATLQEGDEWYAVSKKWYTNFEHFAYFDDDNEYNADDELENREFPPPLNDSLLKDTKDVFQLQRDLNENQHFVWIKKELYKYFVEWFGIQDGSVSFKRYVVNIANEECQQSELIIEMFPIFICYVLCGIDGEPNIATKRVVSISRHETFRHLIKLSLKVENETLDESNVRIWKKQQQKEGETTATEEEWNPFPDDNNNNNNNNDNEAEAEAAAAPPSYEEAVEIISTQTETDAFEWRLLNDSEYDIEFGRWALNIDLSSDIHYMIEMKHDDDDMLQWKRSTNESNWRESLSIGTKIDIYDSAYAKWYTGQVISIEDDKSITITYDGYSAKYDETVDRYSDRIDIFNSHTAADPFWSTYNNTTKSTYSYDVDDTTAPLHNGCVGLRNLGNTCFMNSTIQCLCHCPLFVEYFLDKERWMKDVNRENPLGWKGKVAENWSNLLEKYWSAKYCVLSPNVLKQTIAKIQPRFSGYQQHDSSELLQFLLDGLHEDLNRIKEKPYTEKLESNNTANDAEIARKSWKIHKERNDSVIVDLIQGQLKSRVKCPDCERISVTFDPFMFLSVPIPTDKQFITKVMTVIHMDLNILPRKYAVKLEKLSSISDLKDELAIITKIPKERLIIADIWNHHIYNLYKNYDSIDQISDNDHTICYEVASDEQIKCLMNITDENAVDKFKIIPIYHQVEKTQGFGAPLVLKLPVNYDIESAFVSEYIEKLIKPYIQNMDKWKPTKKQIERENKAQEKNKMIASLDSDDEEQNTKQLLFDSSEEEEEEEEQQEGEEEPQEEEEEINCRAYTLVVLDKYGKSCGLCNYSAYCNGCNLNHLQDSTMKISDGPYDSLSIGIRWKIGAKMCFNHNPFLSPLHDKSVAELSNKYDNKSSYNKVEKTVALSECIDEFVAEETLSKNDAWYCRNCKEHKEALKKLDLYTLPDILIIHLKRFSQNGYFREKNESCVKYPIKSLDLTQWIQDDTDNDNDDNSNDRMLYDLFAVSIHSGGLGGGHYIAYAKNLENGEWYDFDDSCVTPIDENAANTSSAYVLFYNKKQTASD